MVPSQTSSPKEFSVIYFWIYFSLNLTNHVFRGLWIGGDLDLGVVLRRYLEWVLFLFMDGSFPLTLCCLVYNWVAILVYNCVLLSMLKSTIIQTKNECIPTFE